MTTVVLGPSLGTSAATLWGPCAALLGDELDVVAWDLPGHGANRGSAPADLTIAQLAAGVLDLVAGPFHYAGDSVGGAVGLQIALDAPDRLQSLVMLCSGARLATPESWHERIDLVSRAGTSVMVGPSAQRWFAAGFLEREPDRGGALLSALAEIDDAGYLAVCHALATFDLRDRLAEVAVPVLAVAGSEDTVTPPSSLQEVADGVPDGRLVVLDGVGHLAPVERPEDVARLVLDHCGRHPSRRTA
jgi:3-oxoadipate enol-lactonase/4-carboxymuconolactone decarboxylase